MHHWVHCTDHCLLWICRCLHFNLSQPPRGLFRSPIRQESREYVSFVISNACTYLLWGKTRYRTLPCKLIYSQLIWYLCYEILAFFLCFWSLFKKGVGSHGKLVEERYNNNHGCKRKRECMIWIWQGNAGPFNFKLHGNRETKWWALLKPYFSPFRGHSSELKELLNYFAILS